MQLNSMNSSCLQQDIEISFLTHNVQIELHLFSKNGEDNDFAVYLRFLQNMT